METLLIALGTAFGMVWTIYNFMGLRWVALNPNKTDIACTIIMFLFFSGTSTQGIFVSILGGLFVSIMTKLLNKIWVFGEARGMIKKQKAAQTMATIESIANFKKAA